MADGVPRVPLPDGKIYHFNIIYNHARSPMSVTPDTRLSRTFAERVTVTLESLGFVNSYYHDRDALPGKNVFTELFRVVEGSDYTVVVLTLGFVQDCWKRYTQMSAFKTLLDGGQSHKFIPISVGLREVDLPRELNTEHVLFFDGDWERDEQAWNKLKRVFVENRPVPVADRDQDLYIVDAYQETNAPDGALGDDYDGNRTGRQTADHSIHRSSGQGDSQDDANSAAGQAGGNGQSQGQDGENGDRTVMTGQSGRSSEVSVGRSALARRHEDESAVADIQGRAVSEDREQGSGSREGAEDNTEQSESELLQTGTDDNTGQTELGAVSGWNAEFHNDGGMYDGVSMNLEQRQAVSNPSVNLEQRHQGVGLRGQRSSEESEHYESQPGRNTGRRDLNTDGATSLPGVSLRVDGGDIETSVVNRLESRLGICGYRQELYHDQTEKKSLDGSQVSRQDVVANTEQTERKVIADTPEETVANVSSSENIPSDDSQSGHTLTDLTPDGPKESSLVQHINSSGDQINESPTTAATQANTSTQDRSETNTTTVTKPSTQGDSPSGDVVSMQSSAEHEHQNTSPHASSPTEGEQMSPGSLGRVNIDTSSGIDAQELEAVLYRESLPPLDDSGIDTEESCNWSRENSMGSESLIESLSPEETPSGDLAIVQQMLTSSDRGTPDGSVEGGDTFECYPEDPLPSDETIVSKGFESELKDASDTDTLQGMGQRADDAAAVCEIDMEQRKSDNEGAENSGDESDKYNDDVKKCVPSESLNTIETVTSEETSEPQDPVMSPATGDVAEKAMSHRVSSAEHDSEKADNGEGKEQTEIQTEKQVITDNNNFTSGDRGTIAKPDISDMIRITNVEEAISGENNAVSNCDSKSTKQTNGHPELDESPHTPDVKTSASSHISNAETETDVSQKDELLVASVTPIVTQAGGSSKGSFTHTVELFDTYHMTTEDQQTLSSSHTDRCQEDMPKKDVTSDSVQNTRKDMTGAAEQGHKLKSSKSQPPPSTGRSMARFACRVLFHAMFKPESPFYV